MRKDRDKRMANVVMKNRVHEHEDGSESPTEDCPGSETAGYSEDCKDEDGT